MHQAHRGLDLFHFVLMLHIPLRSSVSLYAGADSVLKSSGLQALECICDHCGSPRAAEAERAQGVHAVGFPLVKRAPAGFGNFMLRGSLISPWKKCFLHSADSCGAGKSSLECDSKVEFLNRIRTSQSKTTSQGPMMSNVA